MTEAALARLEGLAVQFKKWKGEVLSENSNTKMPDFRLNSELARLSSIGTWLASLQELPQIGESALTLGE